MDHKLTAFYYPSLYRLSLTVTFILILAILLGCNSGSDAREEVKAKELAPTYKVNSEDEEMLNAHKDARNSLRQFIDAVKAPGKTQHSFALKRAFADPDSIEHLWITDISFDGNVFRGSLSNPPSVIKGLAVGDEIEILPEDISDWMFVDNGKLVGGFSLRVLKQQGKLGVVDFEIDDSQKEKKAD